MPNRDISLLWLLLFLVQGCSAAPDDAGQSEDTGVVISGIIITNELAYGVTDVMIEVPATGAFAGCGNILARSRCRNTFQDVNYRSNAVVIRWKEHGQPKQTREFVIDVPDNLMPGVPSWIEVVIYGPGQAGARLLQPGDRNH